MFFDTSAMRMEATQHITIQKHWRIEKRSYWVLDIVVKEDDCRIRKGFTSQNLLILRKMALHFVADHKDKLSINNRKYQAAIDV